MITQDRLKQLLTYNPDIGSFVWNESRGRVSKGAVAGTVDQDGYIKIRVDGHQYLAHHLAWIYMFDKKPSEIDHIDRVRNNNSINNLREVTSAENSKNTGMWGHNTSGFKGVSWNRATKKWVAYINVNSTHKHLGTYLDFFAAISARLRAEKRYNFISRRTV